MSGDSNGRRSEGGGRGRGRDPHRDRTRSRSRSRSPLSPVSRRGAAPERREAPSLEDAEPSDSGDELVDPASLEAETDHGLCRQIRHQYRALINSVQRKAGRGGGAGRAAAGAGRRPRAAGWSAAPEGSHALPGPASVGSLSAPASVVSIELRDLGWARRFPRGRTARLEARRGRRLTGAWTAGKGRGGTQTPGSCPCSQRVPACGRRPSSRSVTR